MKTSTLRKTFIASVLMLTLTVAMLLGSTYAWFTDSASTGVNMIYAGTLDVVLLDADNDPIGSSIAFKKNANDTRTNVLWEPGATFELEPVVIKNNGDLAFTYKVEVSGLTGSTGSLMEAIDWTVKVNNTTTTEATLLPGATATITISGTMKTDADNDYMGLTANGITINVFAKQAASEYDSTGNNYDASATYDD